MDGDWLEWRHFERFWDEFEEKGWELGPVRYVALPPIMAEFGPYRIVFRYRDPATDVGLFEVREMQEGEERKAVLVWGVPTPQRAESLLDRYGASPDEEVPATERPDGSGGLWGGLLPPVVRANEPVREAR